MAVFLSIHPRHAEAILSGEKQFELRKAVPTRVDDRGVLMLLYATAPVMKVVGCCWIQSVLSRSVSALWRFVGKGSAVSVREYRDYFKGRDVAYALQLVGPRRFRKPLDPRKVWPDFVSPQSFRYLSNAECLTLGVPKVWLSAARDRQGRCRRCC